ncbi:MAG: ABC transporter ATP-binding protein [Pseudomonadota bacterium]
MNRTDANPPLLRIHQLCVDFSDNRLTTRAVDQLSLDVHAGQTLGIVGESGSGKSVTALAVMGLLPPQVRQSMSGTIELDGQPLTDYSESQLRAMRGADVSMIFQEPMTALNPVRSVGDQVAAVLRRHQGLSRAQSRAGSLEMLDQVGIARPAQRLGDYPHQLSGGMRQRVMIAMALACRPKLLIADEPTTALDVTTQAQVLQLIDELKMSYSTTVILITHDLGIVANHCDQAVVLRRGQRVECGPVARVFHQPEHAYTQALINAIPRIELASRTDAPSPANSTSKSVERKSTLLEVDQLGKQFSAKSSGLSRSKPPFMAVDGVSFGLEAGQTFGLVGESGSGKTTLGRMIVRLIEPSTGRIEFDGQDLTALKGAALKAMRKRIQIVFQDPFSTMSPRRTVLQTLREPLDVHAIGSRTSRPARVRALLDQVGLPNTALNRYPHEFSGGQRQRIAIARALAVEPKLIVADEAVSALDVSVQARILNLIQQLQDDLGVAFLFISHDLAVVQAISHRVGILYRGELVEQGSVDEVYTKPQHPHTQALLRAVPQF